ncbi:uncharacterized protein LOC132048637 [Lycium ferocissimum]|uniref:uncharacterized protein LOC132048637 n=1 Tax=Lycium ferocissimum TaxID=112874 RepID=UPI0028157191|nr:uncharacterized protein LOC132048637 [Lycium ferocissimum]
MATTSKQRYNGTFVSASTMDGAGNILPLAYGVIDSENDKSWTWFFEQFKEAYGLWESMCVVSDKHESIIKAVSKVYHNVPHFACIWHLWKNVYNKYRKSHKVLSGVYYAMAKAYTQDEFDMLMEKVATVDIRVKDYLELAGRKKWSRLYAPVNRAWTMTSNIAESINSALVQARELPIFDFLEEVRIMFGRWNFTNRQNGSYTFTTLGKKFNEMLSINERTSARMTVIPSTEYVHTVIDEGRRFIVCIEKKTCAAKSFGWRRFPAHMPWAFLRKKSTTDNYCSKIYKLETVMKTYDIPLILYRIRVNGKYSGYILEEVVFPPRYKRPPGRPKKKRDNLYLNGFQLNVQIRVVGVDMLDTISVLVQMSLEESSWCFCSKSCFLMFFNVGPNQLQRTIVVYVP